MRKFSQTKIVDARTHDLFPIEADELRAIRENTANWKVKEIDSKEPTSNGYCSLNPKEVGIFLTALGYPSSTSIYIAAAEIYDGDARMVDLQSYYPIMMSKVLLVSYMVCDSCLKPISLITMQVLSIIIEGPLCNQLQPLVNCGTHCGSVQFHHLLLIINKFSSPSISCLQQTKGMK
ncbi:hypothetical protein WN943_023024 [Citrus x changshan-huyou]